MTTQNVLTVFLASPGDVMPERDIVRKIIEEHNASMGEMHGVRVKVVGWDTDARPGWGKDGQALINELIVGKSHALFVVLLWNRFGTPTPRAKSGTLEEFKLAVKSNLKHGLPEIMLYFNEAPANLNTQEKLDQRSEVLKFKSSIKNGLYWTYKGKAHFEKEFRKHYGQWFAAAINKLQKKPMRVQPAADTSKIVKTSSARKVKEPSFTPTAKPTAKRNISSTRTSARVQWMLLQNEVFRVETVKENGARWTVVVKPQNSEDDNLFRILFASQRHHARFSVAFEKRCGTAIFAQPPERHSDEKGVTWTLVFDFSPFSANAAYKYSMNGYSADDIAQMRATWLLLGQKPEAKPTQNTWGSTNSSWIEAHITRGTYNKPILAALWEKLGGDTKRFHIAAPLFLVQSLVTNGICTEVVDITLGAISKGKMRVRFKGRRASMYHNQPNQELKVEGICDLRPEA